MVPVHRTHGEYYSTFITLMMMMMMIMAVTVAVPFYLVTRVDEKDLSPGATLHDRRVLAVSFAFIGNLTGHQVLVCSYKVRSIRLNL